MHVTRTSRYRWLPVRIDDFEKWQSGLLEESARRLGALLDPGGRVHRWGFVGSPVMFRGQPAWLRVSPFLEHEMSVKAWRVGGSNRLLSVDELAAYLGVPKKTVYGCWRQWGLRGYRVGRYLRFRERHVEEWLQNREVLLWQGSSSAARAQRTSGGAARTSG